MNDRPQVPLGELETLLETGLPELPPEDIITQVTPWRQAMDRVLWGLALSAITLQFFGLNYLLPAVGALASFLGFRTLRRENVPFRAAFALTTARGLILLATLIFNASIYHQQFYDSLWGRGLTAINLLLLFALLLVLRQGLRAIQKKAGLPPDSRGADALLLWYALLFALALAHYDGLLISLGMVAAFCLILRSLSQVTKALDEAGYTVQAAPVRLSDRAVALLLAAVLLLGMACCYRFSSRYPMDWTTVPLHEHQGLEQIEANLLDLGFPQEVLRDLSPEDLAACNRATQVVVTAVRDFPINNGRQVTQWEDGREVHTTVYDVEELRLTGVAVRLPGEGETWRLFHHFQWVADPGFWGTEAIQIYTAGKDGRWTVSESTGRLLCEQGGVTLTALCHSLELKDSAGSDMFGDWRQQQNLFATFSLPEDGRDQRGYLAYTIRDGTVGTIVDSRVGYTHQRSWLQYPALTAQEYRARGSFPPEGPFSVVSLFTLQFAPGY